MSRKTHLIILSTAVVLVFGNCLANELIGDARAIFRGNTFYHDLRNVPKLLSRDLVMDPARMDAGAAGEEPVSGCISYRPVTALSFFVDAQVWRGFTPGYHLTNILLHLTAVLLACALLLRLGLPAQLAFWAALIFAVHPVQSEAVNDPGYRSDLLCAVFFLSAFLSYLNYAASRRAGHLIAGAAAFAAALFSKETAVILPALLVGYDLIFTRHDEIKDRVAAYAAFFAVLAGFLAVYFFIFPSVYYPKFINRSLSDFDHLRLIAQIFAQYLQPLFYPWTIKTLPPLYAPPLSAFPWAALVETGAFLTALGLTAWNTRRNASYVGFAALWFLTAYLPASNLMPLPNPAGYRFLYIPMLGFAVVMAWWLTRAGEFVVAKARSPRAGNLLLAGYVILSGIAAVTSNFYFQNNVSACRAMIRDFPDSSRPYWILGLESLDREQYHQAASYFEHYMTTDPNNPFINDIKRDFLTRLMLGRSYAPIAPERAVWELQQSAALNPQFAAPYIELARVFIIHRNFKQALAHAQTAIGLGPANATGYIYAVHCLAELRRFDEAYTYLIKAESLNPAAEDIVFVRRFLAEKEKQ